MALKDGDATMPPGPDPELPCSSGADLFPPTPSVFASFHVFALISVGLLSMGCSLLF